MWAHCDLEKKASLIIHRLVCRFFYSALQGHVNLWFSGQSKDLPELKHCPHLLSNIGSSVQCMLSIYTAALIIQYFLPLKCDQSAPTWCQERPAHMQRAWILLFHLPPFSPVVLIVPFSFVTQSSMDGKSGGLASCAQEPHLLKKIFSDLHSQLVLNSSLMLCLHSIYSIKILAQAGFMNSICNLCTRDL